MPNVTIYLDAELAEQVRVYNVAISATCQKALRRMVRVQQRRLGAQRAAYAHGGNGQPDVLDPARPAS